MRTYSDQPLFLFDLDGTLLRSIDFILECFRHAFSVNGLEPRSDEFWRATIGTPLRDQLRACEYSDETIDAVLATYREYNHTHHDTRITAYEGVAELLAAISQRGLSIGVVTSKSRLGAKRGLATTGLEQFVDDLVSVDDVTRGKPHPEPVRTAIQRLNGSPSHTYFVGDSVHDMRSGRAANVRTVAALWGPFDRSVLEPAQPDHWCQRPDNVLDLLA